MQYAIVHNPDINSMVALPSTEVLNDLAFDKGWRVLHQDISYLELQEWKSKFNIEVMDNIRFYLDYLADSEMTEEDTAYIEACMQENFYEEIHPDRDEEEFDESFSSFEDQDADSEEE